MRSICLILLFPLAALGASDLIRNGSFEQGASSWEFLVNNGAQAGGQLDPAEKHDGKASFKISNASGYAPNVYARLTQTVTGLQPFTTYKVSCWARGMGCGVNWIGGGVGWYARTPFPTGDFDWRQVSFNVTTDAGADNYDLMVLTESTTKALWVTDIRFEPVAGDNSRKTALEAQLNSTIAALQQRVDRLSVKNNAYTRLGRALAQRFIDFAKTGGPGGQFSRAWINLQLEEVSQVLDETEKVAQKDSPLLTWMPPKLGRVKWKNGSFFNDGQPYFFYGYGHFDSVIDDLSNFPALGASLIQDGRAGPSSMSESGELSGGALSVLHGMDLASPYGMRVDFLLSPHYYPAWAQAADVPNGNIGFLNFNIFHPKARAAIGQWAAVMGDHIKDKPALHSVCLANEPVYISSGRDQYSRPQFSEFLKQKHKTIQHLNELYGTTYATFDQVAVPACAMPADEGAKRAYYDWTCFNKKMFADWHGWMDSILKAHGVKAPTHTKIMVFQTLDQDKVGWGVDPELICHATDLAGCDAYAFLGGNYAYDWVGHEFFYDLLHSFRGQPVFNSENHLIPDGSPCTHIPMNHSRAVIWQDGLHHEGSSTIWVWQMAVGNANGLGGSIYFRPANIFGADRALLDLNRLASEVTAINNAKPRVALLDSQPSIFWDGKYKGTMFSTYAALNFMGEPVTFISERQLAAGTAAKVNWLIVPSASHILDTTPAALDNFYNKGGKILLIGPRCLAFDEYDRSSGCDTTQFPQIEPAPDDRAFSAALRAILEPLEFADLRQTSDNQPATTIEFRVVPMRRAILVPMINFKNEAQSVKLPKWSGRQAVDLLSGDAVDLNSIALEPMLPRLLRISL